MKTKRLSLYQACIRYLIKFWSMLLIIIKGITKWRKLMSLLMKKVGPLLCLMMENQYLCKYIVNIRYMLLNSYLDISWLLPITKTLKRKSLVVEMVLALNWQTYSPHILQSRQPTTQIVKCFQSNGKTIWVKCQIHKYQFIKEMITQK